MTQRERIRKIREQRALQKRGQTLLDHPSFERVFTDLNLTQELTRSLLLTENVTLKSVRTDVPLASCGGDPGSRDRFTLLALGKGNTLYNLEPFGDYWSPDDLLDVITMAGRHADVMDHLLTTEDKADLPESWVLLITATDILGRGKVFAEFKRMHQDGTPRGHTRILMVNLDALPGYPKEGL